MFGGLYRDIAARGGEGKADFFVVSNFKGIAVAPLGRNLEVIHQVKVDEFAGFGCYSRFFGELAAGGGQMRFTGFKRTSHGLPVAAIPGNPPEH